tara:strand:+ start:37881 stop:39218 length:1338 start_codon:yes stop_codon:yes gene_type:complete
MLKNLQFLLFLLFLGFFSILQINNLDSNYSYGDDFAQYIMQSKALFDSSINEHNLQTQLNSYTTTQIGPNSYPIGYPVALKTVEIFSSGEFKYYKLINIIFFSFYILFSYLIISKKSKMYALFVSLLLLCSQEILNLSQSIESDLMFSLLCIVSIYFLENKKNPFLSLLIGLSSVLVKLQGVVFLFALTIYFYQKNILIKYRNSYTIFIFSYLLIYISPYKFIFGEYKDHFRQFSPYFLNFRYNIKILSESIIPGFIEISFIEYFIIFLLIFIIVKTLLGLDNISIHSLVVLGYFSFFSLYLNQQGIRFLLVILPSLFLLMYELLDIKRLKLNLATGLVIILVLVNLQLPLSVELPNQAFNDESKKLYSFIIDNVNENQYIAAEKPRLIRLATKKNTVFLEKESILKKPYLLIISSLNLYEFQSELESYSLIKNIGQFNIYELNN